MDDWMTAADAVAAVRKHHSYQQAGFAIARRAHEGFIKTKAIRLAWGNQSLDDAAIDRSFWWAGGHAAMFCDWISGDFETSISPAGDPNEVWCLPGRGPARVKAFGVMFSRAGIDDLLPKGAGAGFGASISAVKSAQENMDEASAAWAALLALWRNEAKRSYERDRDRVTGECMMAGRMQSDAHIRMMSEAAESVTVALLDKARAQGIRPENYDLAKDSAFALFHELAADVSRVAVGASGRMPQPAYAGLADRINGDAWVRIEAEVTKWSLADSVLLKPQAATEKPALAKVDTPLPSDAEIKAKMLELKSGGMTRDDAAKFIRNCPGFESVGNEIARRLVGGELPRGRPKKPRQ